MAAPERFAERQILLLHRGRRPYKFAVMHNAAFPTGVGA
jgi:hypothetical protein